jgi:hypothetical protein
MTSARKWFANRANARKSTGPRTAAGKARSSRNACRHGFAREGWADDALRDAAWVREVNRLAGAILRGDAGPARRDCAFAVAAAQHDLNLIRRSRRALEQQAGFAQTVGDRELADPAKQDVIEPALLARIAALDRYERRALARRQRAIATFDALAAPRDARLQNEANG